MVDRIYNIPIRIDESIPDGFIFLEDPITHIPLGYIYGVDWSKNMTEQEEKPRIPEFIQLLDDSRAIHLKKNQDYAQENNPFSNFERSAIIMSWFDDPVDKAFVNLIGTKLARLAELRNGKTAKNESIYDTLLDLGTYCFLWGAYIMRQSNNVTSKP